MSTFHTRLRALQGRLSARRQRGMTIVELSIVLAIIALVIVAAVIGVQAVMRQTKVNDQLKQSTTVVAGLQKATRTAAILQSTMTTTEMIGLGAWPETAVDRTVNPPIARNLWGKREFANPLAAGIGGAAAFTQIKYTLKGIPREVCPDLVTGLDKLADGVSIANNANGTDAADPGTAAMAGTVVKAPNVTPAGSQAGMMDLIAAGTQCNTNAFSDIHIVFNR